MAIESQLGSAVDQEAFTKRLAGDGGRKIVTGLSALDYGRAMAALGFATLRATAPLLAKAGDADEYNAIATYKLDPSTFTLRRMALEMASGDAPPPGPPSPLLVAIAISLKLEELESGAFPAAEEAAPGHAWQRSPTAFRNRSRKAVSICFCRGATTSCSPRPRRATRATTRGIDRALLQPSERRWTRT